MERRKKNPLFSFISAVLIISLWWALAETTFKRTGVIPSPPKTLQIIWSEMHNESFARAVLSTLGRASVSFAISFATALIFAMLSHMKKFIWNLINPFIALCRSVPTVALVLILLLTGGSRLLPAVVAFLVVFPLCYENLYTAITQVDKKLLTMATVFKVSRRRQITYIYLPAMLPYIFSSIIAGFGMNIKVVISAEVMGLPSMSIGYLILSAKQSYDFGVSFAWLVTAVILSLICEFILRAASRLCMPFRYSDLKILKRTFKKFFTKKEALD